MFSAVFISIVASLVAGFSVNHSHALLYRPALSEWPTRCSGRTYCHIKPSYYPDSVFERLWDKNPKSYNTVTKDIEDRDGDDVACSTNRRRFQRQIYLIKDNNNAIRFVMQSSKMNITLLIEECRAPGRVKNSQYLNRRVLTRQRVDCVEKTLPILFPVLSLDGTAVEAVAPKGGIPFGCSAQVMQN